MAKLEMLPAWAGRMAETIEPPLPPSQFALHPPSDGNGNGHVDLSPAEDDDFDDHFEQAGLTVRAVEPDESDVADVPARSAADVLGDTLVDEVEPEDSVAVALQQHEGGSAVGGDSDLIELTSDGVYHRPDPAGEGRTRRPGDDAPLAEWVVNRPEATAVGAPEQKPDAGPGPARHGPGRTRKRLRTLGLIALGLIVLGAGAAAGFLYTALT
jgi:hypothetical protein